MKFETILKCTEKAKINYQYSQTTRDCERYYRQFKTFHAWLLRHDEKQREEIARLQAQVAEYSEALSYFTTMSARETIEFFTKDGNGR